MTVWDVRQYWESHTPWWVPLLVIIISIIAFIINGIIYDRKNKD